MFPLTREIFQREWDRYSGARAIGPIANLKSTCNAAGWSISTFPYLKHSTGVVLDWLHCSKSHLQKTLRRFWTFTVALNCQHRKDFDIPSIDE